MVKETKHTFLQNKNGLYNAKALAVTTETKCVALDTEANFVEISNFLRQEHEGNGRKVLHPATFRL